MVSGACSTALSVPRSAVWLGLLDACVGGDSRGGQAVGTGIAPTGDGCQTSRQPVPRVGLRTHCFPCGTNSGTTPGSARHSLLPGGVWSPTTVRKAVAEPASGLPGRLAVGGRRVGPGLGSPEKGATLPARSHLPRSTRRGLIRPGFPSNGESYCWPAGDRPTACRCIRLQVYDLVRRRRVWTARGG